MKRMFVFSLSLASAAAVALPASAAPPKPMSETYTASGLPDPTPFVGTDCTPTLPTSRHSKVVDIPAPGTIELKMANATPALDWSVAIIDSKGRMLGCGDGGTPETIDSVKVKVKSAGKYTLASQNFAGTPTCDMKFTYTPAK